MTVTAFSASVYLTMHTASTLTLLTYMYQADDCCANAIILLCSSFEYMHAV